MPHIEGNFATLVYVEPSLENCAILDEYVGLCKQIFSHYNQDVSEEVLRHVSLSRHVYLKPHMIDGFVSKLRASFSNSSVTSFFISPEIVFYTNESRDTCFAALPIDTGVSPVVLNMIKQVDVIMEDFDLDVFYDPPSPHVSLVSCPARVAVPESTQLPAHTNLNDLRIDVDAICIKIGKDIVRIPLIA